MRSTSTRYLRGAKALLMLSYIVLTAILAFHHEPWRDEIDSWLMARDASLGTIIKISPDMGTPVGWYFLLKPLASLGLPLIVQQAITLALVWVAVAILIFQSPFSPLISLLWCVSWYLSFEYSVMSRNYTLGVLGIFALLGSYTAGCSLRLKTFQWWVSWPLIIFSSVHFLALTPGLMALGYTLDGRVLPTRSRPITSYIWPAILMALCVWILWPTGKGQMGSELLHFWKWSNLWHAISLGIFPFFSVEGFAVVVAPLFICYWLLVCRCGYRETLAFVFMVGSLNAIFMSVHFYHALRHCGLNWIILIAVAWVGLLKNQLRGGAAVRLRTLMVTGGLCLVTALNMVHTADRWKQEIQLPFTDTRTTAQYLMDNALLREPIACWHAPMCSSMLGYIPTRVRFWYPGIDQWGSHMFWDGAYAFSTSLPVEQAFIRARNSLHNEQGLSSFLFLSTEPLSNPSAFGLTKLWETPPRAWAIQDERFTVYRWRAPTSAEAPPTPLPQESAETR